MTSNEIKELVSIHDKRMRSKKKKEIESKFHKTDESKTFEYTEKIYNLPELVKTKIWFNSIVLIPTEDQLKHWKSLGPTTYIAEDFPLHDLRNTSHVGSVNIFIRVKAEYLDVVFLCLRAWGFNFRDIFKT